MFDSAKYYQAPHSGDHLAVRVSLGEARRRPSAGYWRLRPETLDIESVRTTIVEDIRRLASTISSNSNPALVWEGWKRRVRSQLQLAQSKSKAQDSGLLADCQRAIVRHQRRREETESEEAAASLGMAVEDMDALQTSLLEHQQDQGFDYHANLMESSTSAFFRPPDSVLRSTMIPAVLLPNGTESNDPATIAERFHQHWGSIFGVTRYCSTADASVDTNMTNLLLASVERRINEAQKSVLDAPLTPEELAATIKHLKRNSAPGLDGFGAALYKLDPDAFGAVLAVVFTSMAGSSHRNDLQALLRQRGDAGYALFLDFAKAYDRVNWSYLFRVLDAVGCGPEFCRWVRLLYSNTEAILSLNGSLQAALSPTRGVKQGDPLSSLLFVLTIEPLGNLLRRSKALGIPISERAVATGLYFADDSTLLSRTLEGLTSQVAIVQQYCAGSGALLNLDKSQLLTFQDEQVTIEDSRVGVPSSTTVQYLGIPIGHDVTDDVVFASLESRIGSRLARWGSRARTYRGRLLILQAMVLSLLWHFTPHFTVPSAMVKRFQALADKYLLTRRSDSSRYYVKLAKSSICYIPFNSGGIQIPHLETNLRAQRVRILQQLSRLPPIEPWRATVDALLGPCVPGGSSDHPFDFLSSPCNVRSAIVDTALLTSWWRFTWRVWSSIPWLELQQFVDPVQFQAAMLTCYVWHSTHPLLVVQNRRGQPVTLVGLAGATRRFRVHFATASGCRCLQDFMVDGWPSATDFLARFLLCVPDWPLRYRMRHLVELYEDLNSIYKAVVAHGRHLQGPSLPCDLPLVGVRRPRGVVLYPDLTKQEVRRLLISRDFNEGDHPLFHQVDSCTADTLAGTIATLKSLRSVVLPVYSDLQFRLSWKLLPTKSRFHFLALAGSGDLNCVLSGCRSVETARHLFMDCPYAGDIWTAILLDWANVIASPITWNMICTLEDPVWLPVHATYLDQLSLLWMITRSIVLYVIWNTRNKLLFEDQVPLSTSAACYKVYAVFGAHFRSLLRSSGHPVRTQLLDCLHCFPLSTRLGRFIWANPRLFAIRNPALFVNSSGRLRAPPTLRTPHV